MVPSSQTSGLSQQLIVAECKLPHLTPWRHLCRTSDQIIRHDLPIIKNENDLEISDRDNLKWECSKLVFCRIPDRIWIIFRIKSFPDLQSKSISIPKTISKTTEIMIKYLSSLR